MLRINGEDYLTIADAAERLGNSTKTVRTWIRKGVIDNPPVAPYGTREVQYFTEAYLRKAAEDVKKARKARRLGRSHKKS